MQHLFRSWNLCNGELTWTILYPPEIAISLYTIYSNDDSSVLLIQFSFIQMSPSGPMYLNYTKLRRRSQSAVSNSVLIKPNRYPPRNCNSQNMEPVNPYIHRISIIVPLTELKALHWQTNNSQVSIQNCMNDRTNRKNCSDWNRANNLIVKAYHKHTI